LLVVEHQGDPDAHAAADSLQRLVTALVYGLDTAIETVAVGSSGESDTANPSGRRTPRAAIGWDIRNPPSEVVLQPSVNLRLPSGITERG
jgi:hypothetical protein